MALGPLERGQQRTVFGDVVGGDADRLGELLDQRAVRLFDADAEACRAGIAARAAVDVGDDAARWRGRRRRGGLPELRRRVTMPAEATHPARRPRVFTGTKNRIRLQLSHCTISSLRRTVLKTCGRSRTWQIVQMPSRASATATPLRLRDTASNVVSTCLSRLLTSAARSAAIRSSAPASRRARRCRSCARRRPPWFRRRASPQRP